MTYNIDISNCSYISFISCKSHTYILYIYILWVLVQRCDQSTRYTFSLGIMRSPVVKAIRKPWGCGKAAIQKHLRNTKAAEIAELLLDRLDVENIQLTGSIFPRGTLKSSKNRGLFNWVGNYSGRVFTRSLLRLTVKKLLRYIGPIPLNPQQSFGSLVQQQSERLGRLVRQAKRLKEGLGYA